MTQVTMQKTTRARRSSRRNAGPLVAVTVAGLLAGCMVGPDYRRPATTLPTDFAAVATTPPGDATPIDNDWWKLFNDPLLNQLVAASLANNPNVRLAVARVEEARAALRETNASFFPEIDLSGLGLRARSGVNGGLSSSSSSSASTISGGGTTSGNGTTGVGGSTGSTSTGLGATGGSSSATFGQVTYSNIFRLDAGLSYELDLWGRLRRASEASRAALLETTFARDVTTLSLAGTTAQSYFALRSLDAQIKVTENTLQAVGESLDIAQRRLAAGYSSALDYAQAETLRAQTQVNLRDLRRARTVQEHQIGNLTSDLTLRIAPGGIDDLPVPATPPPGLPSTLLERRPDVARDEQAVVVLNAEVGIAKANLFPTFGLTGAYGGQSLDLSDLLKAPFRFWSFGLGISGPLFAGGKYIARLDEARSRSDQQVAVYQTTVEQAFREVADALTNVAETGAAEAEVQVQVEAARRTLRLSRLRYQAGYSAYLDVLDATRTANAAELTLVQNRVARLNYSVDLIKALGGGWAETGPTPTPVGQTGTASPAASASSALAVDRATVPTLSSR